MNIKDLVKKWDAVLSEGGQINSDRVKKSTAIMLENQHNYLMETIGWGTGADSLGTGDGRGVNGTTYPTSGMFQKIAVPMVRRTFPELVAHQLVGVQPLTGPVGLAFALRFRAGNTAGTYVGNSTELGYNNIDSTYSGSYITSAGEALGSRAGTGVGGTNEDVGLGIGAGNHIREVNMTVEKTQVEAKTRKLRSRWSLEIAQDLKAMHGLNLEEEMMDILAYEITQEIDRELIANIDATVRSVSGFDTTWDFLASAQGVKGRWEMERYRELYHHIIRRTQDIAINTRRGSGNWVVGNPRAVAILETLASFAIAPVPGDVTTQPTGVSRIGSLDGRLVVYRDTFETRDQIIVGYKGSSEYDTGVIYLPYIQLLASRAVFENSFNPTVGLMSRYAVHRHLFGAYNYYQLIQLANLPQ
jgi:Major capsid protein Gp23